MRIKSYNVDDRMVTELGRFAILWNLFEHSQCENSCNPKIIREIAPHLYIDNAAQTKLARVLNERCDRFGQDISEYVDSGMYPRNAKKATAEDKELMEAFLEQRQGDLRCGCLLVIARLRNNLMHGLKCVEELNDQYKLFCAVNDVLESIEGAPDEQVQHRRRNR
jgi:hypothetical protein